jgi:hypothetical protein
MFVIVSYPEVMVASGCFSDFPVEPRMFALPFVPAVRRTDCDER